MRKTRRVSPSPAKKGRPKREVKDRLVQTRVPEHLEHVLKQEAQKRRLTVSHLIRNMLEDTLDLVDTVVTGAGEIIDTSAGIAREVKRDAERLATTARDAVKSRTPVESAKPAHDTAPEAAAVPEDRVTQPSQAAAPPPAPGALDHVLAWNAVVVNRPARCASCSTELSKGTPAHLGVTTDPTAPPAWLCAACLAKL